MYRSLLIQTALVAAFIGCGATMGHSADQRSVPWQPSLEDAFPQADEQNKIVFVTFVAEWCGYCRRLQQTVLPSSTLSSVWTRHAVPVRVDVDRHPGISARFAVRSLPTAYLMTPDGKVLGMILGLRSAEQYRDAIVAAGNSYQQYQAVSEQASSGDAESVLLAAELEIRSYQWTEDGLRRLVQLSDEPSLDDDQRLRMEMLTLMARLQTGEWDAAEQTIDRIMSAFPEDQLGDVTDELEGMRTLIDRARTNQANPQG